jgi:F420-dependent oxidoreductase-like protein
MRFSIWPDASSSWPEVMGLIRHCDGTGWDGAYLSDHFMPNTPTDLPVDGPVLECWAGLAGLAALTNHLRLGSLVSPVTYRHPAVLAHAACTVDHISGGRFVLGLGAGWQVNEHHAYGFDLPEPPARLDRLEEACSVVTSLLTSSRSDFRGRYYRLDDAPCEPKPLRGTLPLLVGGTGERRTMAIAARFAQEWNGWCTAELFRHKTKILDSHCETSGRDPSSISRSSQVHLFLSDDRKWLADRRKEPARRPRLIGAPAEIIDQVGQYAEAGLDELIIYDKGVGQLEARKDSCDRFITEVAPAFI